MSNIHNIKEIHKYVEDTFPTYQTYPISTTNPTKMNIIVPVIPEPMRDIMDFVLLVSGASLNTCLSLLIILNPSMYTSTSCYVMSMVASNLVILLEPLEQVLRWIFDIDLKMNLDYIFFVSFTTSILTIILLNIETYVIICQKTSSLRKLLEKITTAIKGILFIWIMCIMTTSMELHFYDHFEKHVMYDIYLSFKVMFLLFPCIIFILLDCFILYDLKISKWIDGTWPHKDVERFVFLVGITIGFLLTMVPYPIVRAIFLVRPTAESDMVIEIVYTINKMYPMILPIICFVTSEDFRRAFELTLYCQCQRREIVT